MGKEFDIEITDEYEKTENKNVQLPLNFLSFGEIEHDDVKIYIKQDVYKALEKYSSSDTKKELGTILIGNYCEELGKTHVVVSDYIEAKYTDASAATLTFTHETWEYVHKQHELLYPKKRIIGWQHTHPNYGIFLSNYDLFIQENFFNMSFQIAYVIDPIQNIRGFFQWKNGKIEKLKGYYIYDEVGKPIKIEQKKIETKSPEKKASSNKGIIIALTIISFLTICLGVFTIKINNQYEEQQKRQETLEENLIKIHNQLVSGEVTIDEISTVQELITRIENNEVAIKDQENTLNNLKKLVNSTSGDSNDNNIYFIAYTIKAGDSLTKICNEHNLDYEANKNIIFALNGISNPDSIYIGQRIILPIL